ncbi:type VI secretion system baseplate subunit TssE [Rhodoferax aquaticus]|uniref:Type VI secretion system baseplate subunit TssE n=1 Tax=Rhodoferax aquaticus TaxID=2527691 RepID=A0A515EPT6_9BURK|nr:type VI secretion system baseplate subunit TssE [Rhodoferax aquaticus]QDL54678.1 type VI secretion system baseplate subunit TssE [Rhodoferax aquaticus]
MSNVTPSLLHPGARPLPSTVERNSKKVERRYLPTLFDRLCDDAPSQSTESPEAYASSRSQLRQIILRDLALLLNTTDQSDLIDRKAYPAAAQSTINYGVPALAGGYLSEKKWVDIETMIRSAIVSFEPRLMPETLMVKPVLKEQASGNYNVLTFEISGHIQMQPYPLELTVQSSVDLETNRIELHLTRS